MTVEFKYEDRRYLRVTGHGENWSLCERSDLIGRHEGVWNSRVLAFVPQQPQLSPQQESMFYSDTFSDGTPVASYEGLCVSE